jgi:hypothetical protein
MSTNTLPNEMTCYISQFLEEGDQLNLSNTNMNNHNVIVDMKKALEKRRVIEKDAIETLLKSNIQSFITCDGSWPKRLFKFEKLSSYINQFGIYDDSIIDENGLFRINPVYTGVNLNLLKAVISLTPEKALAVVSKMVKNRVIDDVVYNLYDVDNFCVTFVPENIPESIYGFTSNTNALILGENVTHIMEKEYWNNLNLETVIITGPVTSIGEGAFSNCENLVTIKIPDSIMAIRESAFSGCRSLETFVFPNTIKSLGYYIFQDCSSIKSITLPSSIDVTEKGMFMKDKRIRDFWACHLGVDESFNFTMGVK